MNLYKIEKTFITAKSTTEAIAHLKAINIIKFATESESELICECEYIIPTTENGEEMNLYLVTGGKTITEHIIASSVINAVKKFNQINPVSYKLNVKFICKRNDIISTIKTK